MYKVLLINMPFATTKWPSLGISMLKPQLTKKGFNCDIRYFNFDFASAVGVDLYEKVSLYSPNLLGERIFAKVKFGDKLPSDDEYIKTCGLNKIRDELFIHHALAMSNIVEDYLNSCADLIHEVGYDCIGFTNMFEQTVASVSLADKLKTLNPKIKIVMGGANCDGEMGIGLLKKFSSLDVICRGEADETFPEIISRFANNEQLQLIPGLLYRNETGDIVSNDEIAIVNNLDQLPFPDYDDYFSQLKNYDDLKNTCMEVHLQCSRGCWWGEKIPCKFCGLNRNTIKYRSKSASQVLKEIDYIDNRYLKPNDLKNVSMTDNVLDMEYFDSLIPELIKKHSQLNIFFEVKSSLSNQELQKLFLAGIKWVQPGIESLCTGILQIMSKGVTGINNVRFLKQCMTEGIYATWNLIYGFPKETREHYQSLLQIIPKIVHLIPPEGFTPLAMQRFSTFFNDPEKYGIVNVRPECSYNYIFPFDQNSVNQLAYFFDFDYTESALPFNGLEELTNMVNLWTTCYSEGQMLTCSQINTDTLIVKDSRCTATSFILILENMEKEIYEYCYEIRNFSEIATFLKKNNPDLILDEKNIHSFLNELVTRNLILNEGEKYLSLAIPKK